MAVIILSILIAAVFLAAFAGVYRMLLGPDVADRILAFDTLAVCLIGLLVLFSVTLGTEVLLELILIFSCLGFFGTVAMVYYLNRHLDRENDKSNDKEANS